jgi:hypothetical protein
MLTGIAMVGFVRGNFQRLKYLPKKVSSLDTKLLSGTMSLEGVEAESNDLWISSGQINKHQLYCEERVSV